jgi:hypothetical protein
MLPKEESEKLTQFAKILSKQLHDTKKIITQGNTHAMRITTEDQSRIEIAIKDQYLYYVEAFYVTSQGLICENDGKRETPIPYKDLRRIAGISLNELRNDGDSNPLTDKEIRHWLTVVFNCLEYPLTAEEKIANLRRINHEGGFEYVYIEEIMKLLDDGKLKYNRPIGHIPTPEEYLKLLQSQIRVEIRDIGDEIQGLEEGREELRQALHDDEYFIITKNPKPPKNP